MTDPKDSGISLFEYVLAKLEASKGKWASVAEGSGVSYRTLEKIARREIVDPGISHVEKLAKYFREQSAGMKCASVTATGSEKGRIALNRSKLTDSG